MRAGMRPSSRPQRGAALIVVLMLLLVVTLLGLASMRDAIMQERMAKSYKATLRSLDAELRREAAAW